MLSIIQAAGWPIWPLILCSVLGLALVIERFVSLKTSKIAPPTLLAQAMDVSRQGLPGADVVAQLEQHSVLGRVLASALHTLHAHPTASEDDLRASLEGAGRLAAADLQR